MIVMSVIIAWLSCGILGVALIGKREGYIPRWGMLTVLMGLLLLGIAVYWLVDWNKHIWDKPTEVSK